MQALPYGAIPALQSKLQVLALFRILQVWINRELPLQATRIHRSSRAPNHTVVRKSQLAGEGSFAIYTEPIVSGFLHIPGPIYSTLYFQFNVHSPPNSLLHPASRVPIHVVSNIVISGPGRSLPSFHFLQRSQQVNGEEQGNFRWRYEWSACYGPCVSNCGRFGALVAPHSRELANGHGGLGHDQSAADSNP